MCRDVAGGAASSGDLAVRTTVGIADNKATGVWDTTLARSNLGKVAICAELRADETQHDPSLQAAVMLATA